jgi:hypothetical protein
MAEKKLTVRFSTEGGQQVRADMQGMGQAGEKAFGQIARSQKSAADSAAVFEAALEREEQAFRDLRASLDPAFAATQRYEAAVEQATQAVRMGIATQEEANRVIDMARGRMTGFDRAMGAGARGFASYRGQIQNAAFQMQDFAVQVGAGTAASTALAMQLPQLLGGFGAIGAILGAGAAIGIPLLALAMRDTEEAAADLGDQIEELTRAMAALQAAREAATAPVADMARTYGLEADQARRFLAVQAEIARIEAQKALDQSRQSALAQFGDFGGRTAEGFREAFTELQRLDEELARLEAQRAALFASDEGGNFIDIERQIADLRNARAILADVDADVRRLVDTFVIGEEQAAALAEAVLSVQAAEGPEQAAEAAERLAAMLAEATDNFRFSTDEARELGQQLLEVVLRGMEFEALNLAAPISAAAGEAWRLADNMNSALHFAQQLAMVEATAPEQSPMLGFGLSPVDAGTGTQLGWGNMRGNPSRPVTPSGGGRAPSGGGSPSRAGGAPDAAATPDWYAAMIDETTAAQERYNAAVETGADTVADLFMSIVDGSKSAKEALADLLLQLAQVQIQRAVLGLAGGGGTMGSLFGSLGSALTVPSFDGGGYTGNAPRTGGYDGRGGFLALLHPNETVSDHSKGQSAGGTVSVVVRVEGGELRGEIESVAGNVAARVVSGYDRQLPGRVRQITRDPRGK